MSIWCEINLLQHSDNAYKPGDLVHGIVKYVLTEDTVFSKITISLKGFGNLEIVEDKDTDFYKETYVDTNEIVLDNEKGISILAGTHEVTFDFFIPENVPPTFKYYKHTVSYEVHYEISYFIRIKFERPELLDNRFKTSLYVANIVESELPTTPLTYGLEKKPFKIFKGKDKIIRIQSTIENSITTPLGCVKMQYKIENYTDLNLKGVEIALTKEMTIKRDSELNIDDNEILSVSSASAIKPNGTQAAEYIIDIPSGALTLKNSERVSRNYFINIIVELPFPHRDAVLKIPIEIMDEGFAEDMEIAEYCDSPSYAEVMTEYIKDGLLRQQL